MCWCFFVVIHRIFSLGHVSIFNSENHMCFGCWWLRYDGRLVGRLVVPPNYIAIFMEPPGGGLKTIMYRVSVCCCFKWRPHIKFCELKSFFFSVLSLKDKQNVASVTRIILAITSYRRRGSVCRHRHIMTCSDVTMMLAMVSQRWRCPAASYAKWKCRRKLNTIIYFEISLYTYLVSFFPLLLP